MQQNRDSAFEANHVELVAESMWPVAGTDLEADAPGAAERGHPPRR